MGFVSFASTMVLPSSCLNYQEVVQFLVTQQFNLTSIYLNLMMFFLSFCLEKESLLCHEYLLFSWLEGPEDCREILEVMFYAYCCLISTRFMRFCLFGSCYLFCFQTRNLPFTRQNCLLLVMWDDHLRGQEWYLPMHLRMLRSLVLFRSLAKSMYDQETEHHAWLPSWAFVCFLTDYLEDSSACTA